MTNETARDDFPAMMAKHIASLFKPSKSKAAERELSEEISGLLKDKAQWSEDYLKPAWQALASGLQGGMTGSESLKHEVALATALHVVDVFARCMRGEERKHGFTEVYTRVRAGLEYFECHANRPR
jgi:hypothetical protein